MSLIRQKVKFDKKLLDQDALKILKKLTKSGYEILFSWRLYKRYTPWS